MPHPHPHPHSHLLSLLLTFLLLGWCTSTTLDLSLKLFHATWRPSLSTAPTFDDGLAVALGFAWILLYVYLGFLRLESENARLVRERRGWEEWKERRVGLRGGEEDRGRAQDRELGNGEVEAEVVQEFWAVDGNGECVWVRRVQRATEARIEVRTDAA